jgi:hypothetical protein
LPITKSPNQANIFIEYNRAWHQLVGMAQDARSTTSRGKS